MFYLVIPLRGQNCFWRIIFIFQKKVTFLSLTCILLNLLAQQISCRCLCFHSTLLEAIFGIIINKPYLIGRTDLKIKMWLEVMSQSDYNLWIWHIYQAHNSDVSSFISLIFGLVAGNAVLMFILLFKLLNCV